MKAGTRSRGTRTNGNPAMKAGSDTATTTPARRFSPGRAGSVDRNIRRGSVWGSAGSIASSEQRRGKDQREAASSCEPRGEVKTSNCCEISEPQEESFGYVLSLRVV
jgi:hypothetical protein